MPKKLHPRLAVPEDLDALDTGHDDDLDDLLEDDYLLSEEAAELPIVTASELPATNPSDPDEENFQQDDGDDSELEGLGSSGDRVTVRAVKRVIGKIQNHASNAIGYCLKEIRTVNEVTSKYMCAKDSLYGAPRRHKITNWDRVPRGSIVYFDGPAHQYGHITESLGGGYVGSTDWPLSHWGRVHGATMKSSWNYSVAYWSPFVNDVRVWWPRKHRKRH